MINFESDLSQEPDPPDMPDVGVPDVGVPDIGPPDVGVPEPLPDTGVPPVDCEPVEIPARQLPQSWPFGMTETAWNDVFLNWAKGIVVDGAPKAENTCSLPACHGGQDPDSPLPFISNDSIEYASSIESFYPYLVQESAYEGSEYAGRLWRHIDPGSTTATYVGLGGTEIPAYTEEDIDFLKSILQMAWACRAVPELEAQAGCSVENGTLICEDPPNCGVPPPPVDAGPDPIADGGDVADAGVVDAGPPPPPPPLCYCAFEDPGPLDTSMCSP